MGMLNILLKSRCTMFPISLKLLSLVSNSRKYILLWMFKNVIKDVLNFLRMDSIVCWSVVGTETILFPLFENLHLQPSNTLSIIHDFVMLT